MHRARLARLATLGGVVAAVALLPTSAALASAATGTTVPLSEDGERYYYFEDTVFDGSGGVPVTPGSTLRVPAPPAGAAWETGTELVLFDADTVIEDVEALADTVESLAAGEATGTGGAGLAELAELAEVTELAEVPTEESTVPGSVEAGTIEPDPAVPGGVRVVLDGDLPAGSYVAGLVASGPDVEVLFFVTLAVAPGDPVEVTLDYASSPFVATTFVTVADVTVPAGSRVTLTAPDGVDLREFDIEAYLLDGAGLEFPFYAADELGVEDSDDGSSLTLTVPTVLPVQGDGEPATEPLPAGSAFELFLFRVLGDDLDEAIEITEYVVTDLTAGAAVVPTATATGTTTATTTPRIPTAVPAGDGPVSATGGAAVLPVIAGAAALASLGVLALAAGRGRRIQGSHR